MFFKSRKIILNFQRQIYKKYSPNYQFVHSLQTKKGIKLRLKDNLY